MKIRWIEQHDEKDCGAACLAMIVRYYGCSLPMAKFREMTKTDLQGATLYGMIDGASQIGMKAEALKGNFSELCQSVESNAFCLPFIALTIIENYSHYVVVYKISGKYVYTVDPGRGYIRYTKDAFQKIWTEYIITLKKDSTFRKRKETNGFLSRFFFLLKGQRLLVC